MFQRQPFGPYCQPKGYGNHCQKKRKIESSVDFSGILEYSPCRKRPPIGFLGTLKDASFQVTEDKYVSFCTNDLVWAFTRMQASFQQEPEDEVERQKQSVLSWSGFNSLLYPETPCSSIVGYWPMLQGSSMRLSTIYTVLKPVLQMCKCICQEDAVVTFDLAIFSKEEQIHWSPLDEFKDTVIRFGASTLP